MHVVGVIPIQVQPIFSRTLTTITAYILENSYKHNKKMKNLNWSKVSVEEQTANMAYFRKRPLII